MDVEGDWKWMNSLSPLESFIWDSDYIQSDDRNFFCLVHSKKYFGWNCHNNEIAFFICQK